MGGLLQNIPKAPFDYDLVYKIHLKIKAMFCYLCQEIAQGKGCTLICGKTAEVAGLQDLLMYLMKGISKLTTT